MPVFEHRVKRVPDWAVDLIDRGVRRWDEAHPGEPSGIRAWWAPRSFGEFFRALSMFDPDFARAFIDGRMYGDFSHEHALGEVGVPILLMHARWMRLDAYGLVGAMDDQDVARVVRIAPQTRVRTFATVNHVIHRYDSRGYVRAVRSFGLGAGDRF